MKNGTVVLIFNTFELMQDNVIDLIISGKYSLGRVFSTLTRQEGHSVIYAKVAGTEKTVTSRAEMLISKYGNYFIPLEDVKFFVNKYYDEKTKQLPDIYGNSLLQNRERILEKLSNIPPDNRPSSLDHDIYD